MIKNSKERNKAFTAYLMGEVAPTACSFHINSQTVEDENHFNQIAEYHLENIPNL